MEDQGFLPRTRFSTLIETLQADGYQCLGPQLKDGAILFDTLASSRDLPQGITDDQQPGHYRLGERDDDRMFAWANGPQALKPLLFHPRETLWQSRRDESGHLDFHETLPETGARAVIGVRACDLAALALQDAHFLEKTRDPYYAQRRQDLFIVAVDCTHPADTCFCVSTGDGPRAEQGFDLSLHELDDGFIVRSASTRGESVAAQLALEPVTDPQTRQADRQTQEAREAQTRSLPSRNLRDALFDNLDHSRWQEVAERCLSCSNCVSVCPTCFCHTENEVPDLEGQETSHVREWDSCFTEEHSYIHGIVIRAETPQRYRQWLTHKLGSWHDQYGRSGCVGCGRCITWCPVGIDLTEEAAAICGDSVDE